VKKMNAIEKYLEKKADEVDQMYGRECLLELLAEGKISSPKTVRFVRRESI